MGTSDSADDSAPNNRVPSVSPSAWPASTIRTSSPLIFLRLSTSASCASRVSRVRSPKFWLGLLSITTVATDDNGSRSSRVNDGLASASRISASAVTRTAAPRARLSSSNAAITVMAASASQSTSEGTSGVNAMPYCIYLSSKVGVILRSASPLRRASKDVLFAIEAILRGSLRSLLRITAALIAPAARSAPARAPGRLCSFRSAYTSRC